jgi:hypothetical protein
MVASSGHASLDADPEPIAASEPRRAIAASRAW